MDENINIQNLANNIMVDEKCKKTIRVLLVKSWNLSIVNSNEINILDKLEDTKKIFAELLYNYIADNYNYNEINDNNKSIISNIIVCESYNNWLKNLIHFNSKNNYKLKEEDVMEDDFPSNKWVEIDFN